MFRAICLWLSLSAVLSRAASAVELPEYCRVQNRGPMCAWACLETLARVHGIQQLFGLRDYRFLNKYNEKALDPVVEAELQRLGVNYLFSKNETFDPWLLELFAESHGVMVSFKPGTWSQLCHAVIVTEYGEKQVKFWCPDATMKNGKPHIWTAQRSWFDSAWMGNSVVVAPRTEYSPAGASR